MKDFRVHSLEANYVGPFEHLYIEFKEKTIKDEAEVHIFTGENGTGKSTVLYLLACYGNEHIIRSRIQSNHYKDFNITGTYTFLKGQNETLPSDGYFAFKNIEGTGLIFQGAEHLYVLGKYLNNLTLLNPLEYRYSFAIFAYSGHRNIERPRLEAIQEIAAPPLENALNFFASSNAQILLQWIANTQAREALALKNGEEKAAKGYELALNKLQQAISAIVGTKIEFELKTRPFDVIVKWNNSQLTFEVLPDGLKSIISWLGDLIMRLDRIEWETEMDIFDRNFIIFLDEIDIHLHPAWQRKILPVIKKLFKNAQIFVSTHSPFVVGSVDGAWVYKLKKDGQYSVLDGEPMLSNDARSYQTILDDIFGIKVDFGVDVERKLDDFYDLRQEILEGKRKLTDKKFQKLVKELAPQSIEVESIIAMELRQLERITKSKELQKTV